MNNDNGNGIQVFGMDADVGSNVQVDDIESPHANVMELLIDGSGSMAPVRAPMQTALGDFKKALVETKEHEANELLVSRVDFSGDKVDISGYRRIDDFDTAYSTGGMTPLNRAITVSAANLLKYLKELIDRGLTAKAVFAVFSDGDATDPQYFSQAKQALETLRMKEIKLVFIAYGQDRDQVIQYAKDLGFIYDDQNPKLSEIKDAGADAHSLRETFDCLSKSTSAFSKTTNGSFNM